MIQLPSSIAIKYRRVLSCIRVTRLVRSYIEVFRVSPVHHPENQPRKSPLLGKTYVGFNGAIAELGIPENYGPSFQQKTFFAEPCFEDGLSTKGIPLFR